jgi:HK97 family phage prohead protease
VSEQTTRPPRDTVIRATSDIEFRDAGDLDEDIGPGYLGLLRMLFSPANEWAEINSSWEGHFMERFAPGAWTKTINESASKIRSLFQHGQDPQIGKKPLGPFHVLEERDGQGGYAEVKLLDTSYNRDLLPGLKEGLYGTSHQFTPMRMDEVPRPERTEQNPRGIKEVTITEARLRELGPVTFPAYQGATAGIRSMTDEFLLDCFRSDPERLREMFDRATELEKPVAASEEQDPAPSADDAAQKGTSPVQERRDPGRSALTNTPGRRSALHV